MIEILHVRDPDGNCTVEVWVDGEPTDDFMMADVDPGRGYERRDWEETKDYIAGPDFDGSPAFKAAAAQAYEEWADNKYIEED